MSWSTSKLSFVEEEDWRTEARNLVSNRNIQKVGEMINYFCNYLFSKEMIYSNHLSSYDNPNYRIVNSEMKVKTEISNEYFKI